MHVTLLHGFPLDHRMWDDTKAALAEAGHDVLAPDLPGFGANPPTDPVSMAGLARHVVDLWDKQGIQQSVVVGFSMGGYVALQLASLHQDRLAGLVLVDTRAEGDSDAARAKRLDSLHGLRTRGGAAVADTMLPALLSEQTRERDPELAKRVHAMMLEQPPAGLAAAQMAMAQRPDMGAALQGISVPTLVVVGEQDAITPLECAERLTAGIGASTVIVIPDAAHLVPMEQPERFAGALRHWLSTL